MGLELRRSRGNLADLPRRLALTHPAAALPRPRASVGRPEPAVGPLAVWKALGCGSRGCCSFPGPAAGLGGRTSRPGLGDSEGGARLPGGRGDSTSFR